MQLDSHLLEFFHISTVLDNFHGKSLNPSITNAVITKTKIMSTPKEKNKSEGVRVTLIIVYKRNLTQVYSYQHSTQDLLQEFELQYRQYHENCTCVHKVINIPVHKLQGYQTTSSLVIRIYLQPQ